MPSAALIRWRNANLLRLDELEKVHADATGRARGRRWGTEQFNRTLFVVLTAQFQDFCRALHDQAVTVHVRQVPLAQQQILGTVLTRGRKLDTGTPRKGSLGGDFGTLGLDLLGGLKGRGVTTVRRLDRLEMLVDFRNAIVHGNEDTIRSLVAGGVIAATKGSYVMHRRALNGLAATMDDEVAGQLGTLLKIGRPW